MDYEWSHVLHWLHALTQLKGNSQLTNCWCHQRNFDFLKTCKHFCNRKLIIIDNDLLMIKFKGKIGIGMEVTS